MNHKGIFITLILTWTTLVRPALGISKPCSWLLQSRPAGHISSEASISVQTLLQTVAMQHSLCVLDPSEPCYPATNSETDLLTEELTELGIGIPWGDNRDKYIDLATSLHCSSGHCNEIGRCSSPASGPPPPPTYDFGKILLDNNCALFSGHRLRGSFTSRNTSLILPGNRKAGVRELCVVKAREPCYPRDNAIEEWQRTEEYLLATGIDTSLGEEVVTRVVRNLTKDMHCESGACDPGTDLCLGGSLRLNTTFDFCGRIPELCVNMGSRRVRVLGSVILEAFVYCGLLLLWIW